jgi:hypothetical protein
LNDERVIVNYELKGFGRKLSWLKFKVPSRNFAGDTVKNHEKPQSG